MSLVSIIVPCYNYGKFLADALESLISQTYTDWECVIVNDGSIDDTENVALKFVNTDSRFKYIYQKNQGHSAARNTALKHSKGNLIQFLDADDMLEYDKLKLQVQLLDEKKYIDLVYSEILLFDNNDESRTLKPANFFKKQFSGKNEMLLDTLVDDNFFLPGCVLMKRSVYERVGELKASYGYEDWEFFCRAALLGFYFQHDSRIGTRLLARGHGNNATSKHKEMLDSKIKVRKEIMNVIETFHTSEKSTLSSKFITQLIRKHQLFLISDVATYQMYYGKFYKGLKYTLLDALYSGKPFAAIKSGLYWRYLKLKGYKV